MCHPQQNFNKCNYTEKPKITYMLIIFWLTNLCFPFQLQLFADHMFHFNLSWKCKDKHPSEHMMIRDPSTCDFAVFRYHDETSCFGCTKSPKSISLWLKYFTLWSLCDASLCQQTVATSVVKYEKRRICNRTHLRLCGEEIAARVTKG